MLCLFLSCSQLFSLLFFSSSIRSCLYTHICASLSGYFLTFFVVSIAHNCVTKLANTPTRKIPITKRRKEEDSSIQNIFIIHLQLTTNAVSISRECVSLLLYYYCYYCVLCVCYARLSVQVDWSPIECIYIFLVSPAKQRHQSQRDRAGAATAAAATQTLYRNLRIFLLLLRTFLSGIGQLRHSSVCLFIFTYSEN